MEIKEKVRIMWLLNHKTLRNFDLEQFTSMGITEIFTPKSFPYDEGNLSANIDYSLDENLTIPKHDLDLLNAQDWYGNPSPEAWQAANRHFDIVMLGFFPKQILAATTHFNGMIILRVFGLARGYSYTRLLYREAGVQGVEKLYRLGHRFRFGVAYEHLPQCEGEFFQRRQCFLPVGLATGKNQNEWTGTERKILFICPRIETSSYFNQIYHQFLHDFKGFQYTIAGAQPIKVHNPDVTGFLEQEEHDSNMRLHRVMFYHSTEPNHIHYHPFEAIQSGMPLIFMANGMLDILGGKDLPGRCISIREARKKITRILNDDWRLIESIKKSQQRLLDKVSSHNCTIPFQKAFSNILHELHMLKQNSQQKNRQKHIAIIIPVSYGGGSLRGTIALANALATGSQLSDENIKITIGHLDDPLLYSEESFSCLHPKITRRTFKWKTIDAQTARRAIAYAGHIDWVPTEEFYNVPDDGINQFLDCDLWLFISDRLYKPLLPIRPYILMVYDYLQRYIPFLSSGSEQSFINAARQANAILVTTQFTRNDAIHYAGVRPDKVHQMPVLIPGASGCTHQTSSSSNDKTYFVWATNASLHKNYEKAFLALKYYYEDLDGKLMCHVTGVNSNNLLNKSFPHLDRVVDIYNQSPLIQNNTIFHGDLSETAYRETLGNAAFLWHPTKIDNGTLSIVEAAQMGITSLSNDYPPMRETVMQFNLNISWMDANNPQNMARQLKWMEEYYPEVQQNQLDTEVIEQGFTKKTAIDYWKVVQTCL